jgi:hypothetical protein
MQYFGFIKLTELLLKRLRSVACYVLALLLISMGGLGNAPRAIADPFRMATPSAGVATVSSGTMDQLQRRAEEAAGAAQRNIGEITGQTEGAMKPASVEAKTQKC